MQVMQLDLLSLPSVHRFAEEWAKRKQQLHILINNAGALYMKGLFLILALFSAFPKSHSIKISLLKSAMKKTW